METPIGTPVRAMPEATGADRAGKRVADREVSLQLVSERMLLGALREHDAAIAAEAARGRAEFLADAGLRFGESLDQDVTQAAMAELALPGLHGWCVVDIVEVGGGLQRLAATLPPGADDRSAAQLRAERWIQEQDDRIGVPAIIRNRHPRIVSGHATVPQSAADAPRAPELGGSGSVLVVPVIAHDVLLGAITFVSDPASPAYSPEDVQLAEALASRCAQALESARLYAAARLALAAADLARADAVAARREAEMLRIEADAARRESDIANATKTLFLQTMSHELRTPLNAISGYVQILQMGIRGPVTAEQEKDLGSIQRSQAHLLDLVNAVLHYAKLESGHVEYDMHDVRVSDVLLWAQALVEPQAQLRHIALTADPCVAGNVVRADAQRLRQILVNLCSNAVKFTPRDGEIEVSCTAGDGVVHLHVRDTGIGIPADKLAAIFEPFVQVHTDLTRTHEGTGLGLSISREMARAMGGDLTVKSVLDRGSTFTLTLPAVGA